MKELFQPVKFIKKYELTTSISKKAVLNKIATVSEESEFGDRQYKAKIKNDAFVVSSLPYTIGFGYKTDLSPIAIGEVEENDDETIVSLKIRMRYLQMIASIFLLCLALILSFGGILFLIMSILSAISGAEVAYWGEAIVYLPAYFIWHISTYFVYQKPSQKLLEMIEYRVVF